MCLCVTLLSPLLRTWEALAFALILATRSLQERWIFRCHPLTTLPLVSFHQHGLYIVQTLTLYTCSFFWLRHCEWELQLKWRPLPGKMCDDISSGRWKNWRQWSFFYWALSGSYRKCCCVWGPPSHSHHHRLRRYEYSGFTLTSLPSTPLVKFQSLGVLYWGSVLYRGG